MNGMSEREYFTHSGLSRGAVQNAQRGGRLVFYADGSINAAVSDVCRADIADPDQQRRSLGGDAAMPTNGGGGTDSYLKALNNSHTIDFMLKRFGFSCHDLQDFV